MTDRELSQGGHAPAEQEQGLDAMFALAASPQCSADGICFAAGRAGLYRSEDGGCTWHAAYDTLNMSSVLPTTSVVVSPGFPSDPSVFAGVPSAILRSVDGGKNWSASTLSTPPPVVSTLVISPHFIEDGTLLAGTLEDGVFRSADRGCSWSAWNFGLLDTNILAMGISPNFGCDQTLFAGTATGLYSSTNGGRAWRETGLPDEAAPVLSLGVSPHYARDGVLFAATETSGLWYSHDRGRSWTRQDSNLPAGAVNSVIIAGEVPGKLMLLVLLDSRLFVSHDTGHTWSRWQANESVAEDIVSVAAPHGLGPNARLLAGRADGRVSWI